MYKKIVGLLGVLFVWGITVTQVWVLPAVGQQGDSKNLIKNPGFEEGEYTAPGWERGGKPASGEIKLDANVVRRGEKSLKIYIPDEDELNWYGWTTWVEVTPDTKYDYSYWIRGENVHDGNLAQLGLTEFDKDGEPCKNFLMPPSQVFWKTFGWTRGEISFTTTSKTGKLAIAANVRTHGTVWLDDFCLVVSGQSPDNLPLEVMDEINKQTLVAKDEEISQINVWENGKWLFEVDVCGNGGTNTNGVVYLRKSGEMNRMKLGEWTPTTVTVSDTEDGFKPATLSFNTPIVNEGTYLVSLEYTSGQHAISIAEARLISKEGVKLVDNHKGFAGNPSHDNVYRFQIGEVKDVNLEGEPREVLIKLKREDFDASGKAMLDIEFPKSHTYTIYGKYANFTGNGGRGTPVFLDSDKFLGYLHLRSPGSERSHALWAGLTDIDITRGYRTLTVKRNDITEVVALCLKPTKSKNPLERIILSTVNSTEDPGDGFEVLEDWTYSPWIGKTEGTKLSLVEDLIEGKNSMQISYIFGNQDLNNFLGDDIFYIVKYGYWDMSKYTGLKLWIKGDGSQNLIGIGCIDINNHSKRIGFFDMNNRSWKEYILPFDIADTFAGDLFDETRVKGVYLMLIKNNLYSGKVSTGSVLVDRLKFVKGSIVANTDFEEMGIEDKNKILSAERKIEDIAKKVSINNLSDISAHNWAIGKGLRANVKDIYSSPVIPEDYPTFKDEKVKPVTMEDLGYCFHSVQTTSTGKEFFNVHFNNYNFGTVAEIYLGGFDKDWQIKLEQVRNNNLYLDLTTTGGVLPWEMDSPLLGVNDFQWLRDKFGKYFLGYMDGEHDLNYLQQDMYKIPLPRDRVEACNNFLSYCGKIKSALHNYVLSVGALNFCHYYGELGYRMLGLEISQTLPSDIMMLSFLRGASKQYGRLWYSCISVWNRWGQKLYTLDEGTATDLGNTVGGPAHGPSLSLIKRLWYVSYMYGANLIGCEGDKFTDNIGNKPPELLSPNPNGKMELEAIKWAETHPDRGVQYTPVALMLDFYSGWLPPKHIGGRAGSYYVWGAFPYEKGDYMIDNFFRLIYPGYHYCSHYEDERGYLTPTPYGDIFDVLLNNAPLDVLKRYNLIVLLGKVTIDQTLESKLKEYVKSGGEIILTASQAGAMDQEFTGIDFIGKQKNGYCSINLVDRKAYVEGPYTYDVISPIKASVLAVNEEVDPLIVTNKYGDGRVTIITPEYWMGNKIKDFDPYYRFLNVVVQVIGSYIEGFNLVKIDNPNIQYIVNLYEKKDDEMILTFVNNNKNEDENCLITINETNVKKAIDWVTDKQIEWTGNVSVPAGDIRILKLVTIRPFK